MLRMGKIVIFGAGKIATDFLLKYELQRKIYDDIIVGVVDNDTSKAGSNICSRKIVVPDILRELSYDYIVIACNFYEEITHQLRRDYAIDSKRILSCRDYCRKKISKYQYRRNIEQNQLHTAANWIPFNPKSTIIYTAIMGDYDDLHAPVVINPELKYVCFTNNKSLRSDIWEIRYVENNENIQDGLFAKRFKILPHRLFPEYDTSIWVDANIQIDKDPILLMKKYQKYADILFFPHYARMCIYDEGEVCIHWGKDSKDKILRQLKKYLDEQYPLENGLMCGGYIVRNHNRKEIVTVMEKWWFEVCNGSIRDQISLPYVLWKTMVPYDLFDLDFYNNEWMSVLPHKG